MLEHWVLATQFLQDKVFKVWKTIAWRGIKVSEGYLRTMRELKEKKIRLND